ncbi:MAG: SDR family NAD(P)-dependent oxidoreductase [Casimicrobiaceae bacterium]
MTSNVLITGATGNLGRAVASAFVRRGDRLVLVARDVAALQRVFGADSADRTSLAVDLLDAHATEDAVAAAIRKLGRVDVLCNLAGGFRMGEAVHETTDATLDALFDVNVRTLVHAARAVVPGMLAQGGGRIVNVAAASGLRGMAHMGAYTASKSAVIRLTEAMAAELRERNINVNCVLPSVIDTPENRAAMPDADPRRWVDPADLAEVIVFLASDAARAVHGAALPVTGLS